jgi:hypothetical protein
MKTVTLALCLAPSVYGLATANESRHAAIVDMPKVITLTHATPDTWHTLLPVQPNDRPTSTAASALVLGSDSLEQAEQQAEMSSERFIAAVREIWALKYQDNWRRH